MTFLHGALAAAGLACVAIPIIIHLLLRRRRKPVAWAAMRFLLEAMKRQRRKLRLQQLVLLATRCLIIALAALALGRPLLEKAGLLSPSGGRTVYLLIDNSVAATLARGDAGDALGAMKAAASRVLASLGPGDRVALVTLGGPARGDVLPASIDAGAVGSIVEELSATDSAADFAGALRLVSRDLNGMGEAERAGALIVLLSEFRNGSADVARALPGVLEIAPGARLLAWPVARDSAENVQIVSVEPLRSVMLTGTGGAARGEQVRVALRRTGDASRGAASTVRVRIVGDTPAGADSGSAAPALAAQAVVRWEPGQTEAIATVQVDADASDGAFASGAIVAEIDRDALAADNTHRRPIDVRESLRVGIVSRRRFGESVGVDRLSPADWLALAASPSSDTPVDVTEIEPTAMDVPTLAALDVVMLPLPDLVPEEGWARLRRFAQEGGLVMVWPPPTQTVHLWTDAMTRGLGLPWRLSREAVDVSGGLSEPDSGAGSGGMLSLVQAELPPLVRSVSVARALVLEDETTASGRGSEVLLRLQDGRAWLLAASPDAGGSEPGAADEADASGQGNGAASKPRSAGLVVYMASALNLEWSDLPARPLMVPLLQELLRQGVGRASGTWSAVAGSTLVAPARAATLEPVSAGARTVSVNADGLSTEPVRTSGLWNVRDARGAGLGLAAVNADTEGSRVVAQDETAVRQWLAGAFGSAAPRATIGWMNEADAGAGIGARDATSPLSLPLLIGALALAVAEIFLARWFSHAVQREDRGESGAAPGAEGALAA